MKKLIKSIIVDDELNARERLNDLLAEHCPEISVKGMAADVKQAIELIRLQAPDLIFLDIRMPRESGFNLLEHFSNPSFGVIFTTAYQNYTIQAIRCSAIDYLLKPIDPEELVDSVNRAVKKLSEADRSEEAAKIVNLNNMLSGGNLKVAISDQEGITFVSPEDILYVKSDSNYSYIHYTNGSRKLYSRTLKDFEQLLANLGFYRPHRSYLVNLRHIKRLEKRDGGVIVLSDETEVSIVSQKKQELMDLLAVKRL